MSGGDSSKSKSKNGKTVEEIYTKKTQLEHILLRPDTYVGSIDKQTQQMWVFDRNSKQIEYKTCTFVPGLFKIFDEIIVNAADNKQRDRTMNKIDVTINVEEGFVRVWNNGQGIPIVVHQEHKIYVPELIFGHLLTGSNFDDEEEKTTGGRNGYGAKLTNIFSKKFIVETADSGRELKYKQEFSKNMTKREEPSITKHGGTDFTCITFYPDLKRFKMDCLDEDIVGLLSKRVYDIAGTNTAPGYKMNVYLNGEKIEARTFEQYVSLYKGLEPPVAFEKVNERWEIGVGVSDGTFQQVSFVNSISTTKGGCHVNYIADQVTSKLMGVVKKKNKGEEVKAGQIKNHLAIYVNCLIVNPAFDSQTKENLTTKASAFGSTCVVSDKLMKLVEKSGVVDNILNWAKFKQTNDLKKKSGSKRNKILGITKLDDANCAGTAKSSQCTLILTEGDSAKALAISGLGVVGRDFYGVFPLKGKLLNVREANHSILMKNEEVQNIVKILGLTFGKVYEDVSSLRYGHLMIMADQDHDGSHIKGLLINFLHHFWPSLLKIKGFMQQFITPIVKCSKNKKEETFFTIPEYHKWRETNDEGRGWHIKYYKGLGTSTSAEAKEYFSNLQTHEVTFKWDERADDMIDMAFAKKRVEDRKLWLLSMEKGVHMDYTAGNVTYDDFVNHELILFSHADNQRSIPHYMDGFKPSQRKVLFSCFKRNLKSEIKVAQLAGYVSEHSAYHHGEASLNQTIIGMAQNFVGSNNINLLSPCGQFGTRLMGGKDAASPRYVFTKLQKITRHIFHPSDDPLLEYLDDDGQSIEPLYYVPVIPMVLVNGSEGIGTGWSTSIPTYNPWDIITVLRMMINGEEPVDMIPWFRGFTGEVSAKGGGSNNFTISGTIDQTDDTTVVISELPVGKWTQDYKQFLEGSVVGLQQAPAAAAGEGGAAAAAGAPFVKDFKENHTDTTVLFTVSCVPEKLDEFQGSLLKKFKLESSCATTNMNMFDLSSQIRKFEGPMDVMKEFFKVRLMFYDKRKAYLIEKLTEEWEKLDSKVRFILDVISGKVVVSNRKKLDIMQDLKNQGYKAFIEKNATKNSVGNADYGEEEEEAQHQREDVSDLERGYDYLLGMKIWSLTMERVNDLKAQRDAKLRELEDLQTKTSETLWLDDLDALEAALIEFEGEIDAEKSLEVAARKKVAQFKRTGAAASTLKRSRSAPAASSAATALKRSSSNASSTASKKSGGGGGGGGGGAKKKAKKVSSSSSSEDSDSDDFSGDSSSSDADDDDDDNSESEAEDEIDRANDAAAAAAAKRKASAEALAAHKAASLKAAASAAAVSSPKINVLVKSASLPTTSKEKSNSSGSAATAVKTEKKLAPSVKTEARAESSSLSSGVKLVSTKEEWASPGSPIPLVVDRASMSLADRMRALKSTKQAGGGGGGVSASSLTSPVVTPSSRVVDLSWDDDDDDVFKTSSSPVPAVAALSSNVTAAAAVAAASQSTFVLSQASVASTSAAPLSAAPRPARLSSGGVKVYTVDSSASSSSASSGSESESDSDSSEEYDSDDSGAKKKKLKKTPVKAPTAAAAATKNTPKKVTAAVAVTGDGEKAKSTKTPKKTAEPKEKQPRKRSASADGTPKAKKAKTASADKPAAQSKKKAPTLATAATSSAKKPRKQQASSSSGGDSSDAEFSDGSSVEVLPARSQSGRARKSISYSGMDADSDSD